MTPATTWIQTVNSPEIYVFKNIFKKTFIYLFLAVLALGCCVGFALVAASGGSSLVLIHCQEQGMAKFSLLRSKDGKFFL